MAEVGYSNKSSREPYQCCSSSSISMNDSVKSDNCATGFYGPKCEFPCRHPNYGELCQLECECKEQYCNHITGCQEVPDPCSSTKRSSTNEAMLISTIVFTLIAVLQFSAYLSLRFIHKVK
uniref:EGF-like domain-containing protein n=1 Tax=Magallana gigas TaxID=29159 RepID=A0A8W8JFZ4_MAGGI